MGAAGVQGRRGPASSSCGLFRCRLRLACADPAAWCHAFLEVALADPKTAFHQDVTEALRILRWVLECSLINDEPGIEDGDVSICPNFESALLAHLRGHGFEPLRGHE